MVKQLVATYKWENNNGDGQYSHIGEEDQLEKIFIKFLNDQKEKYPMWGNYIITSQNIYEIKYTDPSTGENAKDEIVKDGLIGETTSDIETSTDLSTNIETGAVDIESNPRLVEDIVNDFQSHAAWDPRLYRIDEYFLEDGKGKGDNAHVMRVPFASKTAATAFADMSNVLEAGVVQAFVDKGIIKGSKLAERFQAMKIDGNVETSVETEKDGKKTIQSKTLPNTQKIITNDTKDFEVESLNYGVQSIMNPYSLTKLVGGLNISGNTVTNYMYDIRDQRRFYSMQEGNENLTQVSNPTVTQLIKWSNADMWGRTPYSFQDFVYCKYFGLIPNNRLITFRRYTVPTYDNLQFENMYGDQEQKTKNAKGVTETESTNKTSKENTADKTFSPLAYVVTWFGGETGNSLKSLMSFSTGTNWSDLKSDIWNVDGDTGESKQAVIDKFLGDGDHTGLFKDAEIGDVINGPQHALSMLSAKITSLGKFNLALNGKIESSQDAFDKRAGANVDPFDATFRNRIKGPVNRIDSVKKRDAGIKFSQSLNIKCSYKAKAIGGINPKAALLDVLGNCLEMCSPHALFWGGGHRFMIQPQVYPFHDGGWRDSFMAKIYDGKFLGDKGAIATVLSGFKKVGENGDGTFNFDTAKDLIGRMGGSALGLLGKAISSLSDLFGGSDFLNDLSSKVFGAADSVDNTRNEAQIRQDAQKKANNLLTNLKQMWHNRMMAATIMPQINAGGNILVGEPTGEWHLTIGNPLNPIMVIGNLICSEMKVDWDEELGPDDFPEGFTVEYTIEHAMPRDNDAIQSMFNRGMGKFYVLPDYISTSSDHTTYVDKYTKNATDATGNISYMSAGPLQDIYSKDGGKGTQGLGYQTYRIEPGTKAPNSGNWNTTLITKFTPINTQAMRSVADRQSGRAAQSENVVARIRSLAATRKLINV